ncbi:hypothetical protein V8E36_009332 [Tilletia maclaganii]
MPSPAQISASDFLSACRAYIDSHRSTSAPSSHAEQDGSSSQLALGARLYSRGWSLDESKTQYGPQFAFLHRTLPVQVRLNALDSPSAEENLDEDWLSEADDSTISPTAPVSGPIPDLGALSVNGGSDPLSTPGARPIVASMSQSICYSSTWKVPVFYFSVSLSDGTPLTLDQVIRSSIVQHELDPLTERPGQQQAQNSDSAGTPHAPANTTAANLPATFAPISTSEHPITGRPALYLHPCETANWLETLLLPQVAKREARNAMARASSSSSLASTSSSRKSTSASRPLTATGCGTSTSTAQAVEAPLEDDPCLDSPQRSRIAPIQPARAEANPATAAAAANALASEVGPSSPDRTLLTYLETFVALVASAIEMRL